VPGDGECFSSLSLEQCICQGIPETAAELDKVSWILRIFNAASGLLVFDLSLSDIWDVVDATVLFEIREICREEKKTLKAAKPIKAPGAAAPLKFDPAPKAKAAVKTKESASQTDPPVRADKGFQFPEVKGGEEDSGKKKVKKSEEDEKPKKKGKAKDDSEGEDDEPKKKPKKGKKKAKDDDDDSEDEKPKKGKKAKKEDSTESEEIVSPKKVKKGKKDESDSGDAPKKDVEIRRQPPKDGPAYFTDAVIRLTEIINWLNVPGPDSVVTPFRRDVLHALLGASSLSFYFLEISAKHSISVGTGQLRTDALALFVVRTAAGNRDVDLVKNAIALCVRLYEHDGFRQAWGRLAAESLASCTSLFKAPGLLEEGIALIYQIAANRPDFAQALTKQGRLGGFIAELADAAKTPLLAKVAVATIHGLLEGAVHERFDGAAALAAAAKLAKPEKQLHLIFAQIARLLAQTKELSHDGALIAIDFLKEAKGAVQLTLVEAVVDGVTAGNGFSSALIEAQEEFKAISFERDARKLAEAAKAWIKTASSRLRRANISDADDVAKELEGVKVEAETSPLKHHSWELVQPFHIDWSNHLFYRSFGSEVDSMAALSGA
jgi:hypothetical protein